MCDQPITMNGRTVNKALTVLYVAVLYLPPSFVSLEILCPEVIPHGELKFCSSRLPDHYCRYSCHSGYRAPFISTHYCLDTGDWSPPMTCELIRCPLILSGVEVDASCNNTVGNTCSYDCHADYNRTADVVICAEYVWKSGIWKTPDGRRACQRIRCPATTPSSGSWWPMSCSRQANESCSYSCVAGYDRTIKQPIKCLDTMQWDIPRDTILCKEYCSSLRHGHLYDTYDCFIGQFCNFACQEGYVKNYQGALCLSNNKWSSVPCIRAKCTNSYISNGHWNDFACEPEVGHRCYLYCDSGYTAANGTKYLTCLPSLQWDGDVGSICKAEHRDLSQFDKMSNGTIIGVAVIGTIVCIAIVMSVIVIGVKRRRNNQRRTSGRTGHVPTLPGVRQEETGVRLNDLLHSPFTPTDPGSLNSDQSAAPTAPPEYTVAVDALPPSYEDVLADSDKYKVMESSWM